MYGASHRGMMDGGQHSGVQPVGGQHSYHFLPLIIIGRFDKISVHAYPIAERDRFRIPRCRQHNQRQPPLALAQRGKQFTTVNSGDTEINQHEDGLLYLRSDFSAKGARGGLASGKSMHGIDFTRIFQRRFKVDEIFFTVVDQ